MASPPQAPNIPSDLQVFRIPSLPPSFYYIPNFITPAEETYILSKLPSNRWTQLSHRRLQAHPSTLSTKNTLIAAPLPDWLVKFPPIQARFEELGVFKGGGVFEATKHGAPNHVLINEYKPGEGIMPHEDGAAYASVVATVSLGAPITLDIYEKRAEISPEESASSNQTKEDGQSDQTGEVEHHESRIKCRILQEPGSLLVTTGEAYTELLHGISPITSDEDLGSDTIANWELLGDKRRFELSGGVSERGTRISLTYRDVLKVSKVGIGILGKR